MSAANEPADFNRDRAELFESLSHPVRLRILTTLEEGALTFSELKRRLAITSSGHLSFHLEKLDGLISVLPDGTYSLTDDGKEALRIIGSPGLEARQDEGSAEKARKVVVSRTVFACLIAALLLLGAFVAVQYMRISALESDSLADHSTSMCGAGTQVAFNSTVYCSIDVTAAMQFAFPGYSLLPRPINYQNVTFQAFCPAGISNCGNQTTCTNPPSGGECVFINLNVVEFSLTFPDGQRENVTAVLEAGPTSQMYYLSQHIAPRAGFEVQSIQGASYPYKFLLLVQAL